MTKRQMNIRNSVRKQICIWLETNDCKFTSGELAAWMGISPKRVSTEICFLSKDDVVKIVGKVGKYHIYQASTAADIVEYKKPEKMGAKMGAKIVFAPGVLCITTHRIDGGIERVYA